MRRNVDQDHKKKKKKKKNDPFYFPFLNIYYFVEMNTNTSIIFQKMLHVDI